MSDLHWAEELPISVTVCDCEGTILEMNKKSISTFSAEGGAALIGTNVLDCHPEPSRSQLADLLRDGARNVYTIEKNGVKKLIFQTPWYRDGMYCGLIELSLEIPFELPHFIRK